MENKGLVEESKGLLGKVDMILSSSILSSNLSSNIDALKALTFNNYGCLYKRSGIRYFKHVPFTFINANCAIVLLGKFHAASKYLKKAIKLEEDIGLNYNKCCTIINLSVTLSQQGLHKESLRNIEKVLAYLIKIKDGKINTVAESNIDGVIDVYPHASSIFVNDTIKIGKYSRLGILNIIFI